MECDDRGKMLRLSREKMVPPYSLIERLTLYCPQENLEAVDEPLIKNHLQHMLKQYSPPVQGPNTVLLLLPCTKAKPYAISDEHKYINRYLLAEGFRPVERAAYPQELEQAVGPAEGDLLNNGIWKRNNTYLHRMVVSDLPTVLVPYEYIYYYNGEPSMFSRYDDPGLFEHRGNTVGTWREDCTGILVGNKYRWGPQEKAAYVKVHNIHAAAIGEILKKLEKFYGAIFAYVTPKMTHRSFLAGSLEKKEVALPRTRQTGAGREELLGVNDLYPHLVKIIPSGAEVAVILDRLNRRLGLGPGGMLKAKAHFATGGGVATGLVLPETLYFLQYHLEDFEKTVKSNAD